GIVCIKSNIGFIIASAILLFDIKIPTGTPITTDSKLDINTKEKVSIKWVQYPWLWINHSPTIENVATPNFFPDRKNAMTATIIIITTGGTVFNIPAVHSIKLPKCVFIGSNKKEKVFVIFFVSHSV